VDLQENLEGSRQGAIPKMSSLIFEMKNNYYVVEDQDEFHYYAIKTHPNVETSPLIRIDRSPPILLEGVAIIDKQAYRVTLKDLERRIIRKSRVLNIEVVNESNRTSSRSIPDSIPATVSTGTNGEPIVPHSDERTASYRAEMEIGPNADAAWEDQIRALFGSLPEEEGEWEITKTT
jgi:hypothetical protein